MRLTTHNDDFVDRRRERNRLVEAHAHIVDHCIRRYQRRGVDTDDLRQTAFLALVEAAERFDPDRGVTFATFGSRTIDGTLKRYFRDRTWLVRPPRPLQELHLKVRRANEELAQHLGRHPTLDELAAHLDVDVDQIHHALEASIAHDGVSIDAPRPGSGDEAPNESWLGAEDAGFELADARLLAGEVLQDLDPEERDMLRLRFADELSQSEMADRYGISQSYVSRRVRRALEHGRSNLGELEPV